LSATLFQRKKDGKLLKNDTDTNRIKCG